MFLKKLLSYQFNTMPKKKKKKTSDTNFKFTLNKPLEFSLHGGVFNLSLLLEYLIKLN